MHRRYQKLFLFRIVAVGAELENYLVHEYPLSCWMSAERYNYPQAFKFEAHPIGKIIGIESEHSKQLELLR